MKEGKRRKKKEGKFKKGKEKKKKKWSGFPYFNWKKKERKKE